MELRARIPWSRTSARNWRKGETGIRWTASHSTKNRGTHAYVIRYARGALREQQLAVLRRARHRGIPEFPLFLLVGRGEFAVEFVLENPPGSEQRARQPYQSGKRGNHTLVGNQRHVRNRVVTPAGIRSAAPNVHSDIHVARSHENAPSQIPAPRGSPGQHEVVRFPPIIEENSVNHVEIGLILGIQFILVIEITAVIDAIVPNHLMKLRNRLQFGSKFF